MPIGPFRTYSQPVNLRDLEARFEAEAEVTPESLVAVRLLKNTRTDVKILGVGELSKALAVSAHGFSKSAREKIEAAGGTVTWLRGEPVERKPKARTSRPAAVEADEPEAEETAETEAAAEAAEDES
jgi:hypothetical protein